MSTVPVHEAAPRRPSIYRLIALVVVAGLVFAGLTYAGLRSRSKLVESREETHHRAVFDKPRVLTVKAERAPKYVEQILPSTAAPMHETAVYARTSGYLKRWLVDIGDVVAEGQLLAEIETPEVDAQLLQARATLAETKASLVRNQASEALAQLNLSRVKQIVVRGAVSQQEMDDADAAYKVATATVNVTQATIKANEANIQRLEQMQAFQKVVAPFSGTITARNFDPGALIVADNANSKELFHLSQIKTLRVFADVPQTFSTSIKVGQKATVFRREVPGEEFAGSVSRTTNAVDPLSRTLKVEVQVPNPDRALLPGMYLQVRFRLESPADLVRVPGAAVVIRADGPKVAVLDDQSAVHYRPVKLGRDYGTMVEIVSGLSGGETIVVRPGDDLPDGLVVEAATASATP